MQSYLTAMAIFGSIYALLALGLNLAWGFAGMVNLGLAGFYAVGAYASALATKEFGLPIAVGMLLGFVFAGIAGAGLTAVTLRLRGDYLAIVTLGFAEVVRLIASNEVWLTNGTDGISGIAGPFRSRLEPGQFNQLYLVLILCILGAALFLCERLRRSPYGRALRAIREDDVAAAVAGKWVARFKIQCFALGAALAGLAGALYGHYTSYIAPDIFRTLITLYIFLAVTAGGIGNNYGVVLGAFLVIAVQESTRFLSPLVPEVNGAQLAALREILIGIVLLLIMRYRPAGLLPELRMKSSGGTPP
jgi:branched-chain amino acid transport system permease protein